MENSSIQLSSLENGYTQHNWTFTITRNFDNDNFLTSPQNMNFDLRAITQLKQLLAVVAYMTSQHAILTKTL